MFQFGNPDGNAGRSDRCRADDAPVRAALFIVGATIELLGIVLIASPDLVPGAVRLAGWMRRQWRPFANRLRRLLRRPPKSVAVSGSVSSGLALGGHATAIVGTSVTNVEERVEFLLRRDRETQQAMSDLSRLVSSISETSKRDLAALRDELKAHVTTELTAAQADFRAARIAGTVALAIGLALATGGNFA